MVLGKLDSYMRNIKLENSCHTIYKNKLKMI